MTNKKKKILIISALSTAGVLIVGLVITLIWALNQLQIKSSIQVSFVADNVNASVSANYITEGTRYPMTDPNGSSEPITINDSGTTEAVLAPPEIEIRSTDKLYFEYIITNNYNTNDILVSLGATPSEIENINIEYAYSYLPVEIEDLDDLTYSTTAPNMTVLGREAVMNLPHYTLYCYVKLSTLNSEKSGRYNGDLIWNISKTTGVGLQLENIEGAVNINTINRHYGQPGTVVNSLPDPLVPFKQFQGWFTDAELSTEVQFPLTLNKVTKLYAKLLDSQMTASHLGVQSDGTFAVNSAAGLTELIIPDCGPNGILVTQVNRVTPGVTKLVLSKHVKVMPLCYGAESLTEFYFAEDNAITSISWRSLSGTSISKLEIPNNVETIESCALGCYVDDQSIVYNAPPLTELTFEEGSTLKTIGDNAFKFSPLKSINLPDSLESIGKNAFMNCALESISIPANVQTIGDKAFANSISYASNGVIGFTPSKLETVTFNAGSKLTFIGNEIFYGSKISTITLPEGITSIGQSAFQYCSSLNTVNIPASVQYILENAFRNTNISNITFAENSQLQTIGQKAFYNETYTPIAQEEINLILPNNLKTIYTEAFKNSAFKKVYLPNSLTLIENNVFDGCAQLKIVEFQENSKLSSIPVGTFMGTAIEEISIPASVKIIAGGAFMNCEALTSVNFPSNSLLTHINQQAFRNSGLTSISFANTPNLVAIGEYAFENTEISSISFNLYAHTTFGNYCFSNTKLTSLNISQSGSTFSDYCFSGAPIESIHFSAIDITYSDNTLYNLPTLKSITIDYEAVMFINLTMIRNTGTTLDTNFTITVYYESIDEPTDADKISLINSIFSDISDEVTLNIEPY